MAPSKPSLLLVGPSSLPSATQIEELGIAEGFRLRRAESLAAARSALRQFPPSVVLLDLLLPDGDATELLNDIPDAEVILLAQDPTVSSAVETLRRGNVRDYLVQPFDFDRLRTHLQALAHITSTEGSPLEELVGESELMRELIEKIRAVGPSTATVLLIGESGTGKELVARSIHAHSDRRSEPLISVNCGAIPESLVESELFGHEKGAFTGALRARKGVFERADGGTLFLDEIGEMTSELQVRLLRILETGVLRRVGGVDTIEVDVRIIAATNRDPAEAVAEQKLREDLLYRLSVFPLVLPPLRDRDSDIVLLAEHFVSALNRESESAKSLSSKFRHHIRQHHWPGNVRELRNSVEHAFILAEEEILPEHLPDPLLDSPAEESSDGPRIRIPIGTSCADAERMLIEATIEHCGGDKKEASEILDVSLRTLYHRLEAYREADLD